MLTVLHRTLTASYTVSKSLMLFTWQNYCKNSFKNKYKAHLGCTLNFNILLNLNTKMQVNSSIYHASAACMHQKGIFPTLNLPTASEVKMLSAAAAAVSRKRRPVNHSLLQTNGCNELDSSPVWVNVCTQTYINKMYHSWPGETSANLDYKSLMVNALI